MGDRAVWALYGFVSIQLLWQIVLNMLCLPVLQKSYANIYRGAIWGSSSDLSIEKC